MKSIRFLALLLCLAPCLFGFETQGLIPVGNVSGITQEGGGWVLRCADGSSVQLGFLTPDMVRVRTVFAGQDATFDKSWAVERRDWAPVPVTLNEGTDALVLTSSELEVRITRSPLTVHFIERATGRVISADERPVSRDPKSGRVAVFKRLGLDEHFYGLGERAARLDRRRSEFTFWNSDTPGYVEGTDPLYQSIPLFISLDKGRAHAVFYDNSFRAKADLGRTGQDYAGFCAEGGYADYYFIAGPSLRGVVQRYSELTGRMPMPPLWSLGHQQCRYSYYPDSMVEKIAATYRERDLPLDALYLDIHYMDGYRSFTWDPVRFPDPKAMLGRLAAKGIRVVTIVDPGIKHQPHAPGEKGYHAYDEGVAGDHFLKRRDGSTYIGEVWPGKAVFADYTRPDTRAWWGGLHAPFLDAGIAGFWNDMNEPSDFVDKSGDTQQDVVFEDGGRRSSYLENRNLFGMLMSRATHEGLLRLRPDTRPFIITRAGYAGVQRYAVSWTGDNNVTWESLALSLPMFQNMGLSGQSFVGADIPGFMGRGDGELLARAYQVACFTPLFRNHGAVDMYDHEPWRFGPQYEAIVRKYIKLRYQLLPYIYTGMEESHRTGLPLFRPLVLEFQKDEGVANMDDQFMVGDALLAAPIVHRGDRAREVYLPEGVWYDFWSGARVEAGFRSVPAPLDHLPLFVRGGRIVPSTVAMNHVHEKAWSPLFLHIYPDAMGEAAGSLYEDDGETLAHTRGVWRRTSFKAFTLASGVRSLVITREGSYTPPAGELEITLHTSSAVSEISVDGVVIPRASGAGIPGWTLASTPGTGVTVRVPDTGKSMRVDFR